MKPTTGDCSTEPGRAIAGHVMGGAPGGMTAASIYLRHSEKMSEANVLTKKKVAEYVYEAEERGTPWMAMGGLDMSRAELREDSLPFFRG
eukprot:7405671-Pyramimonas_sp.AAC.1